MIDVRYKLGTQVYFADALSRTYNTTKYGEEDSKGTMKIEVQLHVMEYFSVSSEKRTLIDEEINKDDVLEKMKETISRCLSGKRKSLLELLKRF